MTSPIGPVILFDDDHYMYVLRDQALAEAWWEMPDEYTRGFDALARPLRMTGEPHRVRLGLTGAEPDEAGLRRHVAVPKRNQRRVHGQPQSNTHQ
ncbi:hypothetical protein [Streptomyces sp. NPDC058953]|uniref:hypothetical protein n=1 Tax=Streptomyces sp. NPDC058953 TaxID=3346676 RepID=UPI003685D5BC